MFAFLCEHRDKNMRPGVCIHECCKEQWVQYTECITYTPCVCQKVFGKQWEHELHGNQVRFANTFSEAMQTAGLCILIVSQLSLGERDYCELSPAESTESMESTESEACKDLLHKTDGKPSIFPAAACQVLRSIAFRWLEFLKSELDCLARIL